MILICYFLLSFCFPTVLFYEFTILVIQLASRNPQTVFPNSDETFTPIVIGITSDC